MNRPIDIQEAYNELARQHAELTFAFYGFASLVSGHIAKGLTFNAATLADEYEHLAEQAGEQLANVEGLAQEPNPHLLFLARTLRRIGKPPSLSIVTDD